MKKGLKVVALMTALIMCASLFAGCNESKKTASGLEKLALEAWYTQGTDWTYDPVLSDHLLADWLLEETGVFIEDMYGNGGSQWDPKLTKIIASGNIPDLVICGAGQGGAHFKRLDELKKLYKLTPEMLKEYAPNVWKKTPESYWNALTDDEGYIMGIPYMAPPSEEVVNGATEEDIDFIDKTALTHETDVMYIKDACFWIRDDILKQFYPNAKSYDELCALLEERQEPIGDDVLDIPIDSTEEFVDFLYDIKDANIKEDGQTVYAFGYAGGDNWVGLNWFGADMMGYKNHNYSSTWNAKEQKIEIPIAHETVRETGKIQNQMIADKVIDPESLVNTSALYKEKVMNGNYAIVAMSFLGSGNDVNKELESAGKSFRFRPFITQVPNLEQYPAYREEALWNMSLGLTTELTDEEVKRVLNWIDVQFTDEFEKAYYWGPEEAGLYEETEDGKLVFKDKLFNDYFIHGTVDIEKKDRKGLQQKVTLAQIRPTTVSVWDPRTMHRVVLYKPNTSSGFKFTSDSVHVQNVKLHPASQVWDARYSEIPEVVAYWNNRSQWESAFTKALAADPKDFDKKWDEALKILNDIVNVEDLENAMTEVAKPLAEEIANRDK